MNFRTSHLCDTSCCGHRAAIYFSWRGDVPLDAEFEYNCPNCQRSVTFALVMMVKVQEFPKDALIATPVIPLAEIPTATSA